MWRRTLGDVGQQGIVPNRILTKLAMEKSAVEVFEMSSGVANTA
jgi:hypothetical protein